MEFFIYLQDLREETLESIAQALKHELAEEIEEAVSAGIAREIAEAEIIDDYLNRHNLAQRLRL